MKTQQRKTSGRLTGWKTVHESLNDARKQEVTAKILEALEWSVSTFHRKKAKPENLKNYEKAAISEAYGIPVKILFP